MYPCRDRREQLARARKLLKGHKRASEMSTVERHAMRSSGRREEKGKEIGAEAVRHGLVSYVNNRQGVAIATSWNISSFV